MDGVVRDGISLVLFFRVEIGSCAPSFWVIIRARPLSTTMMRAARRVSISQPLRVSATLFTIWQKSPSVTCRLWMWMTGIHGNSESLGDYQSSSPSVNLKIKTLRALSFLTISWLITGNTCVCNKSWSILVRGGKNHCFEQKSWLQSCQIFHFSLNISGGFLLSWRGPWFLMEFVFPS